MLYALFADLLEYPTWRIVDQTRATINLLQLESPQAASQLEQFAALLKHTPFERLEEIYTSTFDLQVVCYPYIGYHLFGESYKRGAFLAQLKQDYRAVGLVNEAELPDHIGMVLRFLSRVPAEHEVGRDLLERCLLPALTAMTKQFPDNENAYFDIMGALHQWLQPGHAIYELPIQMDLSKLYSSEPVTLQMPAGCNVLSPLNVEN